jgi:hypothetical protein
MHNGPVTGIGLSEIILPFEELPKEKMENGKPQIINCILDFPTIYVLFWILK